jgi:CHAT domain-containing protein/Tfp pilus assembly protein PilF
MKRTRSLLAVLGLLWLPLLTAHPLQSAAVDEPRLEEARRLSIEAQDLRKHGQYAAAVPPAARALALREEVLGPVHPAVADALHLLALIYDDLQDYTKAEPLNTRALAIRERMLGPDHPDVAKSLANLAWIFQSKDIAKAEPLYLRALAIQERAFGADHPDVATTLNDLALLYVARGDYDHSILVNERVVAIRRKLLGPDDGGVAKALNNLGLAYENKADYARAESLYGEAVAIWEKALGPEHPDVATGVDNLARARFYLGDYVQAETLYQRALFVREKVLGSEHPELTTTLNNLAVIYRRTGDFDQSEALLLRAVAITEKMQGLDHPEIASLLVNLARVYEARDDGDRAEPLYQRALDVREKALGPAHRGVGVVLTALGQLYARHGRDPVRAESLLERAMAIQEQALGPKHPDVATVLGGLAMVAESRGQLATASAYYMRALAIQEASTGVDHPDVARSLDQLARLARLGHDRTQAVAMMARAHGIRERYLSDNLAIGSERQKREHLELFAEDTDRALSLLAEAPPDVAALRLALNTHLQRKGRALDAMSDSVALLRARATAQDQALFDRLSQARAQVAMWTLRGPTGVPAATYRARLEQLQAGVDQLEGDLSRRSAAFRAESSPVTLEAVQGAIPDGGVLVEFALYRPQAHRVTSSRYAAFVLRTDAEPRWVDLGDAETIDRLVATWRRALADPKSADARRLGRELDAKVMQPVRDLSDTGSWLLISPDGQLNVVPFAALVDEQDRYLLERYTITYLTSGRDLLRLQVPRESRSASLVVAAPEFGSPAVRPTETRGQVDYSQFFFGPLPGVRDEVRALRALLPKARFLIGEEATKDALRSAHGPEILHIATHGFFLPDRQDDADREARAAASGAGTRLARGAGMWTANPLLRSGLALTGANQSNGEDDGILTALEATSLDLWGTRLVVLSACDTGVGDVQRAEGVYGLRRALLLAGAESQLVSLWPVSDRRTRDLMVGYYERLTTGTGRSESLRRVQLQLLRDARSAHPYYWASFIQSGQWTSLRSSP